MVGLEKYYEKSSQVLWSEGASLPGVVADTSRGLLPTLSGNYATNRNGLSGS